MAQQNNYYFIWQSRTILTRNFWKSACVVLPPWVMTVTPCPPPSVLREQLRSHDSLGCPCGSSSEQPHSFFHHSGHSDASTVNGNGPRPLPVCEQPEPLAGPWAVPEETSTPSGNQGEELLGDPNLHLSIEESNKKFMAESEELDDSLMNCHWQPLDTILSNVPGEPYPHSPI
ncbi:putative uncharacterized protein C6orf52 homolog [Peromyscus maniculatus bairdii]|uniref:putative uncharacterized protein C6orf52 homolog n=1 Tax=Peromyscus maniculatus bairdii TaxID=230844 RepID=UPI003FD62F4D